MSLWRKSCGVSAVSPNVGVCVHLLSFGCFVENRGLFEFLTNKTVI